MNEQLLGLTNAAEAIVTEENTALALGFGSLKVFAPPALIRLIEVAATELLKKNLPPESTSVGMSVRAEVKIIAVDGRTLHRRQGTFPGQSRRQALEKRASWMTPFAATISRDAKYSGTCDFG